ncbi:MAG: hypothetical protein HUJ65_02150 [Oscillospiraceae bacterium]|nr:hypothetical protein [Oscillospiraceae bacterium]
MEESKVSQTVDVSPEKEIGQTAEETAKKSPAEILKTAFSRENLKKTIAIIAAAVIIIAAAIAAIIFFSGRTPETVAKRYAEAVVTGDFLKKAKYTAYDEKALMLKNNDADDEAELFDLLSDKYDEDIKSWKDYNKVKIAQTADWAEEDYGAYETTYRVSRVNDVSVEYYKFYISEQSYNKLMVWESIGFNLDDITACKEVTVKVRIVGEDDSEKIIYKLGLCKINGSWKVLTSNVEFE